MAGLAAFDKDTHNAVSQTQQGDKSTVGKKQVGMDSKPPMAW